MDLQNEPDSPHFPQTHMAVLHIDMPDMTLDLPVKQEHITDTYMPVPVSMPVNHVIVNDIHPDPIDDDTMFSFLTSKQNEVIQGEATLNMPGTASMHVQSGITMSVEAALLKQQRFLKKLRQPSDNEMPNDRQLIGTEAFPVNLDVNQKMSIFKFNHSGSLKSIGPFSILNMMIRKIMNEEDVYYTNWATIYNLNSNNKMVVLVLADVNGLDIYNRIQDGRLSSLKTINNLDHSVVFDLFKQDNKKKFWSDIFNCPRVDKTPLLPSSFKAVNYLLCAEDMRIIGFPSEHDRNSVLNTQTDIWPSVPKTDFNRLLAIDCEMVITKAGKELARISVVDEGFQVVYDTLVKPAEEIVDYVTEYAFDN